MQDVNVFSYADLVKTAYKAVRLNTATDGSYFIDTTDRRFADTATRKFNPAKDGTLANYNSTLRLGIERGFTPVSYATAATCDRTPGQGRCQHTACCFSPQL